jgi:hypothetical protein
MKVDVSSVIESTGLENEAELENIIKILDMQKCPMRINHHLKCIAKEAGINGWQWVIVKAYCLGVIVGKQYERKKKCKI